MIVWLSASVLQVPIHNRLIAGKKREIRHLVATNWIRTAAWSLKAGSESALQILSAEGEFSDSLDKKSNPYLQRSSGGHPG